MSPISLPLGPVMLDVAGTALTEDERKRLMHPLMGSTTWIEFPATGTCYRIWGGRAQLDTFEADAATGHIEGLVVPPGDVKALAAALGRLASNPQLRYACGER